MNLELEEKVAVVTGSTAGIGFSIARQLLLEGASVIVNGRSAEHVQQAVRSLQELGSVHGITADLATAVGGEKFLSELSDVGDIDILVCNIGQFYPTPFFQTSDMEWQQLFELNVLSTVRAIRGIFERMIARGEGRVIIVSSETAIKPNPEMIPYAVTKAAQVVIARGLAEMTKGSAVTVNSVLVAATMTAGQDRILSKFAREGESVEAVAARRFRENNPTSLLQRYAQPEEVAAIVTFLASRRASLINGTAQRADGGLIRATH